MIKLGESGSEASIVNSPFSKLKERKETIIGLEVSGINKTDCIGLILSSRISADCRSVSSTKASVLIKKVLFLEVASWESFFINIKSNGSNKKEILVSFENRTLDGVNENCTVELKSSCIVISSE